MPSYSEEVKIDRHLFGWRLYSGKEYIDCNSEYEARYLKVWIEAMVSEIKIPRDENYLKIIVPELEKLKKETDEIIEDELRYVLRQRDKERILQDVWPKIIKYAEEGGKDGEVG